MQMSLFRQSDTKPMSWKKIREGTAKTQAISLFENNANSADIDKDLLLRLSRCRNCYSICKYIWMFP